MDTKVTIIVDNKATEGLVSEHGLSLWIESAGRRILLDTGQGPALESNAPSLGIDLRLTDFLVLSHGHYDHTGGISHVIAQAPDLQVYCHPGVTRPRYSIRNGRSEPIGMPEHSMQALEALPSENVHWVQEPLMLTDAIGLTGPVPRLTSYEDTGGPFYLDQEGRHSDLLEDDLALWINTGSGTTGNRGGNGTVLCLGCAHSGVINTLNYVCDLTHDTKIRAVLGGYHLVSARPSRLRRTVSALRSLEPDLLVPCHCTGDAAIAALKEAFGHITSPGMVGRSYEF